MKNISKWVVTVVAALSMAGVVSAADTIIAGKVKSINADKKEFVLTDSAGKDNTIKLGDEVVVNRGGKEGPNGLKADDQVSVCCHKGALTSTAHYVLVREGDTKDFQLMRGSFKNFDADKKTFTYTDVDNKDWTFPMNNAKVRLNMQASKIEDIKVGDSTLAVVEEIGETRTLKDLMVSNQK